VIKTEKLPALMGMKWLTLNWHFNLWIEGGEGETGAGCGAALGAVHPWRAEARETLEAAQGRWQRRSPASGREEEERLVGPGGAKG
jgi:hypothetical protein